MKIKPCIICEAPGNMILCEKHWRPLTVAQKIQCGKRMNRAQRAAFLAEIKKQLGLP